MSNISRRDFMKTAGVMTLAVAASGVLAGCSTADTTEEVKKTSATTVTVGDYTLSIKGTKLASLKTYKTADGAVDTETQYLIVVTNVKASEDGKAAPNAEVTPKIKNITAASDSKVTAAGIKKMFSLSYEPEAMTSMDSIWGTSFVNKTAEGNYYYSVYTVDTYSDKSFKAPSLSYIVNDKKNSTYTTIDVTIPSAEATTEKTLKGE